MARNSARSKACHQRPCDDADSRGDRGDGGLGDGDEHDEQHEVGQGLEDFDQLHENIVDDATEITGEGADGDADGEPDQRRHDADGERDARAMHDAGQNIPAHGIGAERIGGILAGPEERAGHHFKGITGIDQGGDQCGDDDGGEKQQADDSVGIGQENLQFCRRPRRGTETERAESASGAWI